MTETKQMPPVPCSFSKMMPTGDLVPNPRNPNTHPDSQIELLAKIIDFQGWRLPIVVSKRSGFVVRGHGRLLAAFKLGLKQVPVDEQEYESEAQEWADLVADNRIAELAEMDRASLKDMIESLDTGEIDMELTGFSEADLEDLMSEFFVPEEGNTDADELPDQVEARTKEGDLWQLGKHRLLCGDCTKAENVDKVTGGAKIDMVFADPPYGADIVNTEGTLGGDKPFGQIGNMTGNIIKANRYKPIIGDKTTKTAVSSYDSLKGIGKTLIFWGANYYCEALPPSSGWIVWDKETFGSLGDGELAWTNQKRAVRIFAHQWSGLIKASERTEKRCHPTQKPTALCEWCIDNYGNPQTIFDPFLGSGMTLIAAQRLDRTCYGMEIDPHYCDVAIQRWEDFTGEKAKKVKK